MDKKEFTTIFNDLCNEYQEQHRCSHKEVAQALGIGVSTYCGYKTTTYGSGCPESRHDELLNKFRELLGDDMVKYTIDKYNTVITAELVEVDSPIDQTLSMLITQRNKGLDRIEDLSAELARLKDTDQKLNDAINAIRAVIDLDKKASA